MQYPASKLFIVCAAGAFVACEEPIDLGKEGAARIIINSQLKVGTSVQVDTRVLNSFGAPAESPELDQTVGYINGSDGSEDTLYVESSNGSVAILVSDDLSVEEGVTYELTLEAPGFAPLTSVTTVPEAARFGDQPRGDEARIPPGDSGAISVTLSFGDIVSADNYYYLLVGIAEGAGGRRPSVAGRGMLLTGRNALSSPDGTWLFDDRGFADGTFDGRVVFDASALRDIEAPVAMIELRTVSRAYYNHLLTERQRDRSPVRPQGSNASDNVLGGGGVFGSYSVSYLTRSLD